MMTDLRETHIHGMWKQRTEEITEHVSEIVDTFRLCSELSDHWRTWYKTYKTEQEWSLPPIVLNGNTTVIEAELINGMCTGKSGEPDRTLGYAMRAFAGPEKGTRDECTLFRVTCGKRGPYAGPNTMSFKLPNEGSAIRSLYNPDLLAHTLKGLARIWRPDWLVVRNLLSEVAKPPWPQGPVLGWVNLLPPHTARIESLPTGWRWAEESEGSVFVFEEGLPDEDNPSHVLAMRKMIEHIHWTWTPS